MVCTCLITIVLFYLPYIILGNGQIFGFFATYASEQNAANAGSVTMLMNWLSRLFRWPLFVTYLVDVVVVGSGTLLVWFWRQRERISMEEAMLVVVGLVFLVSTHVFPWYTTALLPWVVLLIGPPFSARFTWQSRELVALVFWYFICLSIVSYLADPLNAWNWYYGIVYDVTLSGLACIAIMSWLHNKGIEGKVKMVGKKIMRRKIKDGK